MMNFESTQKMTKEAMDNMLTTYSSMTKGFQQIAAEAADYSKKSYEDSAAAFEKLVTAKSLDKAYNVEEKADSLLQQAALFITALVQW